METKRKAAFPLHYQIALGLVLGTVAGWFLNPGEVMLPEYVAKVTYRVEERDGGLVVTVSDDEGLERFARRFGTERELAAAVPELADRLSEARKKPGVTRQVRVRRRLLTIIEDLDRIQLQYHRLVGRIPVSTTVQARSAEELAEKSPAWAALYRSHGGGWRRKLITAAHLLGEWFLRLLRMVTIPLIVTSLVTGVASLGGTRQLGRLFWRTIAYYLTTSALAVVTGLAVLNVIHPGDRAELPVASAMITHQQAQSVGEIFRNLVEQMIPPNPVAALAGADFLAIITFSLLLGVFMIRVGEARARPLRELFEAGFEVMMQMTLFIIRLAPIGVFGFLVFAVGTQGLSVFLSLGWYMLSVALGLCVHACVTLPLLVRVLGRRSPLEFARAMSPALLTAFSTASSNGTLPLTMG
ncbi:MAG: dicarboxylate/amino acid:cation symporter, partial [Planctomycetota bacterium]